MKTRDVILSSITGIFQGFTVFTFLFFLVFCFSFFYILFAEEAHSHE